MAFEDLFTFSRARTGEYRDATGALQTAAIDTPRFDHDETGAPRGLLIEGRPEFSKADRLAAAPAAWPTAPGTVLHEYQPPTGEIVRRAWYATDPSAMLGGLLNIKGHHRRIGVFTGFLKNRGGYVSYLDQRYQLGGVIAVEPYLLLDAGDGVAVPLIEG